jgi:enoyl-CoA hydratase
MARDELLLDDRDGVRWITINRPEAKNALTSAMRDGLCRLLSAAERDATVRVVVIGAVDPVFSAGVDFKEPPPAERNQHDAQFAVNPGRALRAMTKPVICAVNGACVSGALEMALSCSFIVASEHARFADTHARLGVVATWGLTALLPRAVGVRRATEMSITGNFVGAEEALLIGLVNHVVAHDRLKPTVEQLAGDIAATPAVGEVIDLYRRGEGLSLSDTLALEADHTARRSFDPASFTAAGRATAARGHTG